MRFGIPIETDLSRGIGERRVALSPAGVRELCAAGAEVLVHTEAGSRAGFTYEEYSAAGGQIVYDIREVYGRADVILRVERPHDDECMWLSEGAAIISFVHLHGAGRWLPRTLCQRNLTVLGLEAMYEDDGVFPLQKAASQIAGRMAPQIAGRLLESDRGGVGILLSGLPGIPPADVVILGAGALGTEAARAFLGTEASVYVLDRNPGKLEAIDQRFGGRVITALAIRSNIEKFVTFAEVLIGAVREPDGSVPRLVNKELLQQMKRGAVILDFAINEGGCVETSRPTPSEDGIFVQDGVLHYALPNVPSLVPRTATYAHTQALLPYLQLIQREGMPDALRASAALRRGTYLYAGHYTHPHASCENDAPTATIEELLQN